jgi:hypothetical protein
MSQDDIHRRGSQFRGEAREPLVLVLGESIFKSNVLTLDITEFTQALAEA